MKVLNGITVLLLFQLLGEGLALGLSIPIPGPVLGMVLLLATMIVRAPVADALEPAAGSLLSHLSLLFVPAGVGVLIYLDLIAEQWLPIVAALLLSTVVTLLASALVMQGMQRLMGGGGRRND